MIPLFRQPVCTQSLSVPVANCLNKDYGKQSSFKRKKGKNDEFIPVRRYSKRLKRIWNTIPMFRGKVVYCNCDDPYESNFFRYFVLNLPSLIKTAYYPSYNLACINTQLRLFGDDKTLKNQRSFQDKCQQICYQEVHDMGSDGEFNLKDVAKQLKVNSVTNGHH